MLPSRATHAVRLDKLISLAADGTPLLLELMTL